MAVPNGFDVPFVVIDSGQCSSEGNSTLCQFYIEAPIDNFWKKKKKKKRKAASNFDIYNTKLSDNMSTEHYSKIEERKVIFKWKRVTVLLSFTSEIEWRRLPSPHAITTYLKRNGGEIPGRIYWDVVPM